MQQQVPTGCGCCACTGRGLAGLDEPATSAAVAAAGIDREKVGAFAGPLRIAMVDSSHSEPCRHIISHVSLKYAAADSVIMIAGKVLQMAKDAIVLAVAGVADKIGLFTLLATGGPNGSGQTAAALAKAGGLSERYVLEICSCLACAGWIDYDKATASFSIDPAHAKLLIDPTFPIGVGVRA